MRKIARDVIVTVQGPGWSYGIARLLIDDEGNAAVFVPPATGPVQVFQTQVTSAARGTGLTGDGGEVKWRRRGAGCSFQLAKCRIDTAGLVSRWN